ncbi:MAG TPA: hypothetical protein VMV04_04350 [Thermodesulfobacteriota bacterium]|nr:hypothetical protein [Thermodesulfobacteriota bacterium]
MGVNRSVAGTVRRTAMDRLTELPHRRVLVAWPQPATILIVGA